MGGSYKEGLSWIQEIISKSSPHISKILKRRIIKKSKLWVYALLFLGILLFLIFYEGRRWTKRDFSLLQILEAQNVWTYDCVEGQCVKVPYREGGESSLTGIDVCKLSCHHESYGTLWPIPNGEVSLSKEVKSFGLEDLQVFESGGPSLMIQEALVIFKSYLRSLLPEDDKESPAIDSPVILKILVQSSNLTLGIDTDESYELEIVEEPASKALLITIESKTYFGARHGLETLSQLIAYDETVGDFKVYKSAKVTDKPIYPHRGILIDTSRNFISLRTLKSIIDGMSYNKLNVLHWHLTDTHSFPFVSKRVPELSEYGSYSPRKVYTADDIKSLVAYARIRGVKLLPEFDAPAHVGSGWEFGKDKGLGDLAVCVNREPWMQYCVEPPCGQLNPINENMYEVLGKLYQDFFDAFESDMFHMGGDEINLNCWNTTKEITDWLHSKGYNGSEADLIGLWTTFQKRAQKLVYKANQDVKLPLILWTSRLTEQGEADLYIDKLDYIIQIWTKADDSTIADLINKGYRTIFSNYDAWYLDCGYASWIGEGNNWCSPYKGWQRVYDNSPRQIYRTSRGYNSTMESNILGGEACMWTEQVDEFAIEGKIWPRGAALAERLWSEPSSGWREAEFRMLANRHRMVLRGINADSLQPDWCRLNEGHCKSDG